MADPQCKPPAHLFAATARTCYCGAMVVPDPTLRCGKGFHHGLGPRRPRQSALDKLRVPQGPGKPPAK